MDSLLRCSRYAFGPNRLHYCGPDTNREFFNYIDNEEKDPWLEKTLQSFATMYPYLRMIATANKITDVFDERVVDAYWLGNNLLDATAGKPFFDYLNENKLIKKKLKKKDFDLTVAKTYQSAVAHHSFHVLNVWLFSTTFGEQHDFKSLQSCLISWGKITKISGPFVRVNAEILEYLQGRFVLSKNVDMRITRSFSADMETESLKVGDIVTFHWGVVCEKIMPQQVVWLRKSTLQSIKFANQTI